MSLPLVNKKALVTGGTKGIGRDIVQKLIGLGCTVTYTGRQDNEPVSNATFWQVDFLDEASTGPFISRTGIANFDILVNNAGINKIAPFCSIPMQDFDDVQRVNLKLPFRLMQATLPHMIAQKWGRIVNVSSIFGVVSKAHRASYSASKFGLDGLTAAISAEVAIHGVLVNSICPGFVRTELTRDVLGAEGMEKIASSVPMNRLAEPLEIANAVGWLCGIENTYMSGQSLIVDGGFVRV